MIKTIKCQIGNQDVRIEIHSEGVDVFINSVSETIPVAVIDTFHMYAPDDELPVEEKKGLCQVWLYDPYDEHTDEAIAFCVFDPNGTQIVPTGNPGAWWQGGGYVHDGAIMSSNNLRDNVWSGKEMP